MKRPRALRRPSAFWLGMIPVGFLYRRYLRPALRTALTRAVTNTTHRPIPHEQIEKRAYEIFLRKGEGTPHDHWEEAERELRQTSKHLAGRLKNEFQAAFTKMKGRKAA